MKTLLKKSEQLSYFFSGLCVIHCLLSPVIILLLPAFAPFFNTTVESILVLMIVPIAFFAFLPKWLKHKNNTLLTGFLTGLTLILSSQFFFHYKHEAVEYLSPSVILSSSVMMIGAIILAISIYKNNNHLHHCTVEDHD